MRDVNYQLLISAARLLQPLLDELVFVGGCVTGLLITDEAVPAARPTLDVDAIVEITSCSTRRYWFFPIDGIRLRPELRASFLSRRSCRSGSSPRPIFWQPNWKPSATAVRAIISAALIWRTCYPLLTAGQSSETK